MNINNILSATLCAALACGTLASCDLDEKFYSDTTPDNFFTSKESTYEIMARPFTHWKWFVGNERWYLQELTTDEMVCPQRGADWYNGGEYFRLHYHTWSPDDRFIVNTYDGVTGGISRVLAAHEDLENVNYATINMTEADKADQLAQLDALKAYFYKKGLDYFGGMPLYDSSRDGAKGRSTDKETFAYVETLLKNAIANLKIKETLGESEDGYIKRAAAAAMLAQLYFNALSYGETDHFGECAQICQDIIDGKYGKYALDDTWYGPHCFTNDKSPEIIWSVPSENSKMQVDWYFKYFYHMNSYKYFNAETKGYNGFMLSPSLKPDGSLYTDKLGRPYSKFSDQDLRKKPYRYMGNEKYEGMFLVGQQVNPNDPSMKCTGQKEYKGKVLNLVDQVTRFSEVGSGKKYASVDELPSTMVDGEENSGIRLVKSPQPDMNDITKRYNPDWPIIRLAEIYYMLAECKLRSGDKATAAHLINKVRSRNFAGGNDPDPVTAQNLDMYRMLDEWMTEFLGEGDGRRRTDLIRWNLFTTATWWDHKADGDDTRNRFPIPNKAISANNLLKQNPGYE